MDTNIPLDVQGKGDGSFEVLIPNEESAERILALNCTEIENNEQILQVKKMPVQFSDLNIFDLLEEQLGEAEDLEASFPRGGREPEWWPVRAPGTRDPTHHAPSQGGSRSHPKSLPR